jgi:DNA-binding NtrC family response regulator
MLRFLQDRTYRRVGSGVTRQADVRILVATNASLENLVETRQFRRDLLYRLNVLVLRMPALRERGGDSVELAQSFLERFTHQYRMPPKTLHPDFISHIQRHDWPGNVRELENAIHRELLMCEGSELRPASTARVAGVLPGLTETPFKTAKAQAIAKFESHYVNTLLQHVNGNITSAARLAGQDRSAFGKLVRKHAVRGACTSALGTDE